MCLGRTVERTQAVLPGEGSDGSAAPTVSLLYPSYITGLGIFRDTIGQRVSGMYLHYLLQLHMNLSLPQKEKLDFKKVKVFQYSQKQSKHL